jgi:lipopolysaccharide biosynthesis protein
LAIDSNEYPIIKTVCPGWDNEARKPGKSHIFYGSSPDAYARWLRGVCDWTLEKCAANSKQPPFMFVNAWNEWAEGAHLEPDRKYGYANLHVTANSLQAITPRSSDIQAEITDSQSCFRRASDGAVVLHLFYGDLLDEILPYLENTKNMDLFVSLGPNVSIDDIRRLRKVFPNCYIDVYLNKGRDLLPFINFLKVIKSYGYAYGCKLHTKKSPHRNDGNQLRSEVFKNLIGTKSRVQKFIQFFEENKELGMAGPPNYFIDLAEMKTNFENRCWLDNLLPKLGRPDLIGSYSWRFFAGTMFWFRVDALSWILSWNLTADDFEYELGQLDGTLAHALERCLSLGVTQSGYRISCELNQSEK